MLIKKLVVYSCVLLVASSVVAVGLIKLGSFIDNLFPVYQIAGVNVARADEEIPMKLYVLGEFNKAGLDIDKADKIIECESRWNINAINFNKDKTFDAGLFQINSIHKNITLEDKINYKTATAWVIKKVKHDGGWQAWVCNK